MVKDRIQIAVRGNFFSNKQLVAAAVSVSLL